MDGAGQEADRPGTAVPVCRPTGADAGAVEVRLRRELLDAVDGAVIATDLERRVIEWSAGAETMFHWSREQAVGCLIDDNPTFPSDSRAADEWTAQLLEAGSWRGRFETTGPEGAGSSVYARCGLIHDAEGRPSGIVGVLVDITEQVRAEREAIQARDYLHAVTDQMVEGLFVADDQNGLTYMNPAAEKLLGYSFDDLAGRNMHEAIHHSRPDGSPYPEADCPVTAVREGRRSSHYEDDDTFFCADGSSMSVAFSVSRFEPPGGSSGVSIVFRDISEEKAERERVRDELEAMTWVGPIREALSNDTMLLYSQPIVSLETGERVQEELLLRMPGRDGGEVIAAGLFVPAAERFHMIKEIDSWVIPRAIEACATVGRPVQFNLSAASIQDPSIPALIEEALESSGVAPADIVIEVTESGLIDEHTTAERFASRIVAAGCRLALDDFGTGYGGFTYLTRLPISILKIDRSFVLDLPSNTAGRKVVAAVVGLAREFGHTTVAEGVEDEETLGLLAELGVDQAQGYLLGRPGPL